jgi:pimeloyl-ACP methyl ester carboxylesterase
MRAFNTPFFVLALGGCAASSAAPQPALPIGVTAHDVVIEHGISLHYLQAGHGAPIVFLHGFAETSHMWLPAMAALAHDHTVIAVDLLGAGESSRPADGYDKKSIAREVHSLVRKLGLDKVQLVGHDIGLMVAYAYGAQYPSEVDSLTLMDAFLPGIGDTTNLFLLRDKWHFNFYGPTPEALVAGRERTYLEHFWNDFAANPDKSVSEADRELYAREYAKPPGMRSTMAYFKAFDQDAVDNAKFARTPLAMPVLVIAGEKASGAYLVTQTRLVASNVTGVIIPDSGHWLMDEATEKTVGALVTFLDGPKPEVGGERLLPSEIEAKHHGGAGAGTSGLTGIDTVALHGDAMLPMLYTIEITVPPHTRIPSHSHPDQRAATVISGIWMIGYGDKFDESKLRALPPGSFYTEPAGQNHFAMTGDTAAVVQLTGTGPTGTKFAP